MKTRFVKPKIAKYIHLYSKNAFVEDPATFDVIGFLQVEHVGLNYLTTPIITISAPPAGGIQATATCAVSAGFITTVTVGNRGRGYITEPTITINSTTGRGGIIRAYPYRRKQFVWELENPIKLDENALLQIVDRSFSYAPSIITDLEPIAIRILDISTQSIVQSRDISGFNNPQTFSIGKLLDIGICRKTFEGDITLEIQPQDINRIVLSLTQGTSSTLGILGNLDFFISLKVTEQEPKFLEYGSLNNININQ